MSATLTTLRLSFGGKEQASLEGEAQAEGLHRDRSPSGGRPRGSGLGWSGRLVCDQQGARSAESSSVGLSPQLDSKLSLHEAPSQQPLSMLFEASYSAHILWVWPGNLGRSHHFSCLHYFIYQ